MHPELLVALGTMQRAEVLVEERFPVPPLKVLRPVVLLVYHGRITAGCYFDNTSWKNVSVIVTLKSTEKRSFCLNLFRLRIKIK